MVSIKNYDSVNGLLPCFGLINFSKFKGTQKVDRQVVRDIKAMKDATYANSIADEPLNLIKLQLACKFLLQGSLEEITTKPVLEILHYYDATKISKNRKCVSDYLTSMNFKEYPGPLNSFIFSQIKILDTIKFKLTENVI